MVRFDERRQSDLMSKASGAFWCRMRCSGQNAGEEAALGSGREPGSRMSDAKGENGKWCLSVLFPLVSSRFSVSNHLRVSSRGRG